MTTTRKSKPEQKPADLQWEKEVNQAVDVLSARICQMFLKAVKEHDRLKIIEIANAVWYFKDKLGDVAVRADPVRDAVLVMRNLVATTQTPMDIKTAVAFAEFFSGTKIPGKEHSYPDFRTLCKELGFTIEPARATRKK